MAKKIVNVVYKVDSSELDKAKATIQSTAQTTKQAEQAMGSYSNTAKQTGTVIQSTIAGMTLRMQQLKAQIELTSQADVDKIAKLKAEYQNLKAKVDEFNKSLDQTQQTGQSAIGVFGGLKDAIIGAISIAALKRIGDMVLNMNELAGKVEGVDRAFRRAFPNSQLLLDQLRKSTHGTVNDFELMQRTLQATNLGVSVEHLGVLFEFAAARAQQTGESVDYLVDSIVRGIGRKSILVLDNLGLSATRLKQQFGGVSIASKSVAEVTAGVAEIAKVELEKMGGYVETSETQVKQLGVAWQSLQQQIAKTTQSSGFVSFLTDLVNGFKRGVQGSEEFNKELTQTFANENVQNFINSQKQSVQSVKDEINYRQKLISDIRFQQELLKGENEQLNQKHSPETIDRQDQIKKEYKALQDRLNLQVASLPILEQYLKQIEDTGKGETKQIGIIEDLTDKIKNLKDALEKATSIDAAARINEQIAGLERSKKAVENAMPINFNVDEAKNDAAEVENLLRTTNEEINKEADESYKEGLQILHNAQSDEKKAIETQNAVKNQLAKEQADEEKRIAKEKEDYKKRLTKAAENTALDSLQTILYYTLINRQNDLQDLSAYYDAQIEAAGNNESAKKKIEAERKKSEDAARNQQLNADKEAAITKIEIDTAINIIRSIMNNGGIPLGIPFGLLAAAAGAVQIATVRSVRSNTLTSRAFAKGEVDIDGPGTTTSDSINARLSKGESVINAQATAASRNLLEAINERKIDDRILHQLAVSGGSQQAIFDSQSIVNAIERNKVDLAVNGYSLMEARQRGSNFKQYIRSKVQGYR